MKSSLNHRPLLLIGAAVACGIVSAASAQCSTPWWLPGEGLPGIQGETSTFGGTIGEVNSSTLWDPDGAGPSPVALVVGGTFAYAGSTRANGIAMWDGIAWHALGEGIAGPVLALAVAPNNHLLVGGYFATAGATSANSIAAWDGASWTALGDGVNGVVIDITVRPNGHVIAAGQFDVAGASVVARGIARWDGTDWFNINQGLRATTSTNEAGSGATLAVLPDGDIIVGGAFERAGGITAGSIARLHFATNGTTSSWSALDVGTDGYVSDVHIMPNGDVIAGGSFINAGSITVNGIARWNGTAWSALGTGMDEQGVVDITQLSNGDIIAAGIFDHINGSLVRGLARWNGSAWSPVPELDTFHWSHYSSSVYSLTGMPDGAVAVGGVLKAGVVRWDGTTVSHFGTGMDGDVTALAVLPSGAVVAGGTFETAGPGPARHVAQRTGGAWSPMGTGLSYAPATLLTLASGDLLAGGIEVSPDGSSATGKVSRWNGAAWVPVSSGFNAFDFVELGAGGIVAAGYYGGTGGAFTWNGTDWELFHGGAASIGVDTGYVSAVLLLPDGSIVIGGTFDAIAGVPATNVARWDGTAWAPLGTGVGLPDGVDGVTSLTAVDGGIVASGWFIFDINAQQFDNIARWDGTTWLPMGTGLPDGGAWSLLTLPNGHVLAAGSIDGGVREWDGFGWSAVGSIIEGTPNALALLPGGTIAVGGSFAFVGGGSSAHYAEFGCAGPSCDSIDFNNDGLFPDTMDIDDFLSVFSGGTCSNDPNCGDIDFNNDGLFPDTLDIDSLLSVFSGGACL